ncbi:diacylglycerol O-acyltransferase [Marmoricola endophyticus]|uniref:Diacylglycerol O-acyltransferase n=1 Tax=Marmoricola endophyticus TaxID=2040280 RepID=A0A917F0V0_9ACTN|nr:diacylglycerol O-acyltransferase [Marmoricola endophyticus]
MPIPLDPTSTAFLVAENRTMPMHVAALQIFRTPPEAGEDYVRSVYEQMIGVEEIEPLFLRRPHRSPRTAGQWTWVPDDQFDIEYHVRHNALPRPGRIRELLELCSRLQGQRLSRERPLWEAHVIEGLPDDQWALYIKMHHSLVDGVAAVRLLRTMLTDDPDRRDVPVLWAKRDPEQAATRRPSGGAGIGSQALRAARSLTADAVGMPAALSRTLLGSLRNETSAVALNAPRTMFNTSITGSRRFAAQGWSMQRLRGVATATRTTLNDVVLAMCSGAVRDYLLDHDALPDRTLVSMVPVSLHAGGDEASSSGGNSVGSVMVQLGTHLADPADRLDAVHRSMQEGKQTLGTMTPTQILAMSAIGLAPAVINPALRVHELVRPPFNLIISNVPGPKQKQYHNGAELVGLYPLSIPLQGMALNITCASYGGDDGEMDFGLTGCRRAVPSLQRLLTGLDEELTRLEEVAGTR